MNCIKTSVGAVAFLAMGLSPCVTPASAQTRRTPVATYWVTAETHAGITALGAASRDGEFNPLALMGGGGDARTLTLQLQSGQAPGGAPAAAHYPPTGLRMGEALPLRTPRFSPETNGGSGGGSSGAGIPRDAGRMLIYSGCGTQARHGQPLVIEMSGSGPSTLAALSRSAMLQEAAPPSPALSRTYGEWPSESAQQDIPLDGSLTGEHLVRGSYTPDIHFSLTADQDFLEVLQLTGLDDRDGSGLGWQSVSRARGYFAYTVGTNERGDVVIWSSSERPIMAMDIPDLLSPASLDRLLADNVVLPPSTTKCPIPEAVREAAPQSMLHVVAYGGEVNVVHPSSSKGEPSEYEVKVRYTSTAGRMLGVGMEVLAGEDAFPDDAEPAKGASPLDVMPVPGLSQVRAALGLFRRN